MAEEKSERYLDRYEVVAVALPGAALILFISYVHPEIIGVSHISVKEVTVGALGIFTIASLIAGQLVQAVANVVEEGLNYAADRFAPSPVSSLPEYRQVAFDSKIKSLGASNSDQITRKQYRREYAKDVVRAAKLGDTSGALQAFNVSYGLHRGLAVASATAALVAMLGRNLSATVFFAITFGAMTYRAYRFSRRYEGEALRIFVGDSPVEPVVEVPSPSEK